MKFRRYIGRRAAAIVLALCLAAPLSGCQAQRLVMTRGFESDELFRIDSQHCSAGEYRVLLLDLQKQCERLFGHEIWDTANGGLLKEAVEQKALSQVSRLKVMRLIAIRDNIMLTDAEESKAEEAARAFCEALTKEEKDYLDVSEKEVSGLYADYLLAQKVYSSIGTSFEERYNSFCDTLDYDINESVWDAVDLAGVENLTETPGFSEIYREYLENSPSS